MQKYALFEMYHTKFPYSIDMYMCTHQFTNLSCWWGTSRWGTSANSIKSLDSKIKTKVNMSTTPKERTKKNELKGEKKAHQLSSLNPAKLNSVLSSEEDDVTL